MRNVYLYLYIAVAFVAGAALLQSTTALAYQSPSYQSNWHTVIPTVPSSGSQITSNSTSHIAAAPVQNSELSQNWAGYVADTASNYTAVGATWSVPSSSASNNTNLSTDATWVGIGGVKSDDLIQAGTQAIIQNGQVSYEAWYEALPGYQQMIPVTVNAGDSVTVSLSQTSTNNWSISFVDNTTGKSYQTSVQYTSSLSSAEWIEEMPVMENSRGAMTYIPLDNFGTVSFTGAYTVANGQNESLQAANAEPLTMASGRTALATPSVVADDNSFTVTRSSATANDTSAQAATSYPHNFRRHEFPQTKTGSQGQSQSASSSPSQYGQSSQSFSVTPGQTQTFSIPGGTVTITFGL